MRSVGAEDTVSAEMKLAREIDEPAAEVAGYGVVSLPMASPTSVRSVVAKDIGSAVMMLASETDESATDVTFDCGEGA